MLVLKIAQSDLTAYHVGLLTLLSQLSPLTCWVIALHGCLNAMEHARLCRAASYHMNASRCEGLCLPLTEFTFCGTSAITPDHSAMVDYIGTQVGFAACSNQEPTAWSQDSRRLYSTRRYRPSRESLKEACLESYRVAREQPEHYWQLSIMAN